MRRIAWISCVLLGLTSGTDAEADVISLEDLFFEGPARENFEFLVGSAFPGGLRNGQGYGAPPAGFQFPESGMILRAPDPNDPGGTGLLIGDFRDAPLIYGLGTNGVIDDPTDVLPLFAIPPAPAGEGFAASGSDEAGEILFEFPRAVSSFGIYTSTHDAEPLTIRSYDAFGGLIEEPFVLEDSEPAPLRNENFIGLTFPGSSIASFSVEGGDYVFDQVLFNEGLGCTATPRPNCKKTRVGKSKLLMSKGKLDWTYRNGEDSIPAEFGDLRRDGGLTLCLYDTSAGDPGLILEIPIPADPDLWTQTEKGFKYKDKDGTAGGIKKIKLRSSSKNETKILLRGKEMDLPANTPRVGPVRPPPAHGARSGMLPEHLPGPCEEERHQDLQGQGALSARPRCAGGRMRHIPRPRGSRGDSGRR